MADNYILSFDFDEISRQISDIQGKYVELSSVFRNLSDEAEDSLKSIHREIDLISSSLDSSLQKMNVFYSRPLSNLEHTTRYFKDLEDHSKSILDNVTRLGSVDLSQVGGEKSAAERKAVVTTGDKVGAPEFSMQFAISAETKEMADAALKKAQAAIAAARQSLEEVDKAEGKLQNTVKKITEGIKGEVGTAKGSMMGMAGRAIPGLAGVGLIGGLLGLMVLGVREEQRVTAQLGEMRNVVAIAGGIFERGTRQATNWLAGFAEKAQYYFGIGRKEIQGIVKQVTNAGFTIDRKLVDTSKSFDNVQANVFTASIALDKFFKISSGTTMNRTLELVRNYGYSLDTAFEKIKRLSFAAQRSGMDMQRFTNAVLAGSSTLAQYGFELDDVAGMLQTIKQRYDDMGVDPKRGGELAVRSTEAITRGLANLPIGIEMILAQEIYPSLTAPEARVKMKETMIAGSEEERNRLKIQMVTGLYKILEEQTTSEPILKEVLGKHLGLNVVQAADFIKLAQNFQAGKPIGDLTEEQKKLVDTIFKREGDQIMELQKTQRSLIKGMAKVGQGILKIVSGILASLILGFKAITASVKAAALMLTPGGYDEGKAIFANIKTEMAKMYTIFEEGSDLVVEGLSSTLGALGDQFSKLFEPVKRAWNVDFTTEVDKRVDVLIDRKINTVKSDIRKLDNKIKDITDRLSVAVGTMPEETAARKKEERQRLEENFQRAEDINRGRTQAIRGRSVAGVKSYAERPPVGRQFNIPKLDRFPGNIQFDITVDDLKVQSQRVQDGVVP